MKFPTMSVKKIKTALISVYHKDHLENLVKTLHDFNVELFSTGGTYSFIEKLNIPCHGVESLTGYPSILGGRVKTLHPKVFGGILARRDVAQDLEELEKFGIPEIDLVVVDLYPFEDTVSSGASEDDIIEKIDIGGISLLRAAAKNYKDTLVVSSRSQYLRIEELLKSSGGACTLEDRKQFATEAFDITSQYDAAIFNHFNTKGLVSSFKVSERHSRPLRYGENPHQKASFYGNLDEMFDQLNGKELSFNNLVDTESVLALLEEFPDQIAFIIIKHTNACGVALGNSVLEAYTKALECDPVSAFGGVLATNTPIDKDAALAISELFFEILIAPDFGEEALDILKSKKNRILLKQKQLLNTRNQFKSLLNGIIVQDKDAKTDSLDDLKTVTNIHGDETMLNTFLFASKICKHTKSNAIVLAKEGQLLASGVGQTSRVDALEQAIEKAKRFGFDIQGSVMASDAFFPFPDCVEIAHDAGVIGVIQPGGSIRDQDSIDYCNSKGMVMVTTGIRHFKH